MRRFGLIGHPLSHSFSKGYFDGKFRELGINAEYLNLDMPTVEEAAHALRSTAGLEGANVTIPYKSAIITYLDELDTEAEAIGAVNTIKLTHQDGGTVLKGHNTDVVGFRDSIAPLLSDGHQCALVLGTGGAAKAAIFVLRRLNLHVTTVSRHAGAADLTYASLTPDLVSEHRVIVNCTPLGMFPHLDSLPALPYHAIGSGHLLYDMVYNPLETMFMQEGLKRGATVRNGLDMLHRQAEASWAIWNRNN